MKKNIAAKRNQQNEAIVEDDETEEYWLMLKGHAKDENDWLRKISKSVVSHFGVSPDVYQGWIEVYLEKLEN